MASLLKYRQRRFGALHALLTGMTCPPRGEVPPGLRRDLGLPESHHRDDMTAVDPTGRAVWRRG